MSSDGIVERLTQEGLHCPCRRPVVGSQIVSACSRCTTEAEAADEIERLRGLLKEHGQHHADCKFGTCWWKEARRG